MKQRVACARGRARAGLGSSERPDQRSARRGWAFALGAAWLLVARWAESGAPPNTVVVLAPSREREPYAAAIRGFQRALDGKGWTISVRAPVAQASLVGETPRWIVALGSEALALARAESPSVPRAFAFAEDERCELVPSEHETGVVLRIDAERIVRTLVEASPKVATVGYLRRAGEPSCVARELAGALARHSLTAMEAAVGDVREALHALREQRSKVDAWVLIPEPSIMTRETIDYAILAGLEERDPVMGFNRATAAGGALLALSLDPEALGAQLGALIARADERRAQALLPAPELPQALGLTINLKTARALGLAIPPSLEARASESIR
ncbi:MAG: ABC transporter substrate binding protein [bacterium]